MTLLCVILTLAACGPQPAAAPRAPRELYAEAAEQLQAGELAAACRNLSELVTDHPDSPLAETAVVHLIECRIAIRQPDEALSLLKAWRPKLCRPQSSLAEAELRLANLETHCRLQLARRSEAAGDHPAALDQLLTLPAAQSLLSRDAVQQECVRLVTAFCDDVQPDSATVECLAPLRERLKAHSLPAAEEQLLRFTAAERCGARGLHLVADQQWRELEHALPEGRLPTWAATVWLRRAEQCARQRDYVGAKEYLQQLADQCPDFPGQHHADFLAARLAIARIEFDTALAHLNRISENTSIDETQRAKAFWMTGEVYFLQHQFPQASLAYEQAIACETSEWHMRALLQAAKCYEKMHQPQRALAYYRQLASQFGSAPDCEAAKSRIAALEQHLSSSSRGTER